MKSTYELLADTVRHFIDDDGLSIAAEASFYLMFSLFPLLFLAVALIGWIQVSLASSEWLGIFHRMISTYAPDVTLDMMARNLKDLTEQYSGSEVIVAALIFTWPASNVFYAYAYAVNTAYDRPDTRSYLQYRLLSFFLLFASGLIMFLTAVVFSLLPFLWRMLTTGPFVQWPPWLFHGIRFIGALLVLVPAIALIYRYGPELEEVEQHVVWPGAFFACVLWLVFSQLFSLYIQYLDTYRALYGTLGGVMLLMLWMYLISLAVILGAEFNQALSKRMGISGNQS